MVLSVLTIKTAGMMSTHLRSALEEGESFGGGGGVKVTPTARVV